MMKVMLTGAFGNIGHNALEQLLTSRRLVASSPYWGKTA